MPGFDASDEALHAAGFQLGVVVEDLETEFAAVRTVMDRLLDGGWSGAAAQSFGVAWGEWVRGYRTASSALGSMAGLLDETGRTYSAAESATLTHVRAIGGELP